MRRIIWLPLLILVGCQAGGTPASGDLASDADLVASNWVALDLTSGAVVPVTGTIDDQAVEWRRTRVLFRQIAAGEAVLGRAVADINAEDDEHPLRRTSLERVWIAVHELTQAQWLALNGTRPWLAVLPVPDMRPWIGDDLPAFGLSPDLAMAACSRLAGQDGWQLDLPDAEEWERACLAGVTSKFAWGESLDGAAGWAVCASDRPQAVGGRSANAWGLHDMHGNVWEIVRDGLAWQVRGGAWDQSAISARASNQATIGATTIGWNVGVRLALRR